MQLKLSHRSNVYLFSALLSWLALTSQVAAEQTWTVNSREMDINQLILSVAKATDKTIIVDPKVKGKVQVVSSKPLNRQEYYQLFLSILDVHGFAAIESGNAVRIIPQKDARTSPVPVADNTRQAGSGVITQVIQLNNISAAKLIPVLRPLAPQQAHMAAYSGSNAIIISDTAANIERIRQVVEKIDRSAREETQIVPLQHAAAEEVVAMLEKIQQKEQGKSAGDSPRLLLVADKRTNSILVNGDELERQRIAALITHIDTPLAQNGNVKVVYLEYANATEMAKVLSKVVQNIEEMNDSPDARRDNKAKATIEADEGTNSLVITANADVMQSLLAVVERLDIRRAQVLVEAIIVEMQDVDARALGLQWLFMNDSGAYGSSTANDIPATLLGGVLGDGTGNNSSSELQANLGGALASTPGQLLGIGRLDDKLSFNVVINALDANTDANILSTPSLLTMDNQEASIVVGQNVPFVTGSYSATGNNGSSNPDNPFQTIERENVGITLRVTPSINEGDSLVLDIEQEVSSLTGAADEFSSSDIITNERKIRTKVLADDGQVIILGGLIQDDIQQKVDKVPLLGDIPVVGRLFRTDATKATKTHLLVFLRSSIIRDARKLSGATAEKYRYIRNNQLNKIEQGNELLSDDQLPLLPEWQQQLEQLQDMRNDAANSEVTGG